MKFNVAGTRAGAFGGEINTPMVDWTPAAGYRVAAWPSTLRVFPSKRRNLGI